MNNYSLNSTYYLVIENNECLNKNLPEDITVQGTTIELKNKKPIELQIVFIANTDMTYDIHFNKFVEADLIITKILDNNANLNVNMKLEEGAIIHTFTENNSTNSNNVYSKDEVHLNANSSIQVGYAELSDGSFKADYQYYLDGEGAEAKVRMAILSKEKENKEYEVLIKHNAPYTYGQMDNYGVVKDEGRLVIDGIGTITKGQKQSASHQTNKIMVFDPKCKASANPYLYIDEYDVKASHAAGVGKMDEEHLYYLQSRGLTKKQAMQLITYGYLKPVIEVIDNEMIKERFETVLSKVGEDHD